MGKLNLQKTKHYTCISWLQRIADEIQENLIFFAITRGRFTWQQRNANDDQRIKIQHSRLQEEQSKQDKVSKGKTVKSVLVNECTIEETFPQIATDILECIKIIIKNPSWLLGKYIDISSGMNKTYNGKLLFVKNSK